MKRFLAVFIILFSCSLAHASVIRITQPKVELELAPGEVYSGEVEVENPTEDQLQTRVYLEDWKYKGNGTGEKDFGPPGTMERSASKWITFAPAELRLAPFSRQTVRYTLTVPQQAEGGRYSVLFFESAIGSVPDPDHEGANILVAGRIGALFFIHIKGSVDRRGEIESLRVLPPEGNRPLELETSFRNTGNVDVTLSGNFLILDAEGKVLGRGELSKIYTFPGASDTRKTQWVGRLPAGSHDLVVTYDLGGGQVIVKEEKLTVGQ